MITVRQWLGRARFIDREITALERQLQKARDDAIRITQNYESDGAQSSKDPHKFDRITEFIDQIREKYQEAYLAKDEITKAIFELEDVRLRTALFNYYVNLMTWEECAVSMHYQWSRMMDIRRMALEAIDPIVKKHLI